MNQRQKAYDSYDHTVKMLKVANSHYHSQNLYLIKNRKALAPINVSYQIKHPSDPINEFYKQENTKYITTKLSQINQKKVKPQLNEDFIMCEKKKKMYSIKKMKEDQKVIERENEQMSYRMSNLQSFISAKSLDKSYNEEHEKMLMKLRKVPTGKLHLPSLSSTTNVNSNGNGNGNNNANMTSNRNYAVTEANNNNNNNRSKANDI